MIKFENVIDIHSPLEQVFAFVADFENIPKWNYYVTQVRQSSSGAPDVGATYHQVRKVDAQDFEITAYQPNRMIAVKTLPDSKPYFARMFTFEKTADGTRITDIWELETGYNRIVEALGKGRVVAGVMENLGKLKQLLETGETQLQDGRTIRR